MQVCDVFLSSELEDVFMELDEDNIASICGYYPKTEDIGFIDNSIVAEIVGYFSNNYQGFSVSQTTEPPDFDKKSALTSWVKAQLSTLTSVLISMGNRLLHCEYVGQYSRTFHDIKSEITISI